MGKPAKTLKLIAVDSPQDGQDDAGVTPDFFASTFVPAPAPGTYEAYVACAGATPTGAVDALDASHSPQDAQDTSKTRESGPTIDADGQDRPRSHTLLDGELAAPETGPDADTGETPDTMSGVSDTGADADLDAADDEAQDAAAFDADTEAETAPRPAADVAERRKKPAWCLGNWEGTCDNHEAGSPRNLCEVKAWGENHVCAMDGRNQHRLGEAPPAADAPTGG